MASADILGAGIGDRELATEDGPLQMQAPHGLAVECEAAGAQIEISIEIGEGGQTRERRCRLGARRRAGGGGSARGARARCLRRQIGIHIQLIDREADPESRLRAPAAIGQGNVEATLDSRGIKMHVEIGQLDLHGREDEAAGEGEAAQAVGGNIGNLRIQPLGQVAQVVRFRLDRAGELGQAILGGEAAGEADVRTAGQQRRSLFDLQLPLGQAAHQMGAGDDAVVVGHRLSCDVEIDDDAAR